MAAVTIIGGHGKVALRLARLLADSGHDVTSWIRNADQGADIEDAGATPAVLDVETMSVDEMATALAGADVVVWSAGAGGGSPERTRSRRPRRGDPIDGRGRVAAGDPLYVMVSYFGAQPDHGVPQDNPFHTYAEAKAAADEHLRSTRCAGWSSDRAPCTDDAGTGLIEVGDDLGAVRSRATTSPRSSPTS